MPRTFRCAHTGSIPCLLEVRVGLQAFPGSLARPKSTPSVFLILRQPGGLHSQPFSTILTISLLNCKCAPTHCHLIKLLKLTKHIRHPLPRSRVSRTWRARDSRLPSFTLYARLQRELLWAWASIRCTFNHIGFKNMVMMMMV